MLEVTDYWEDMSYVTTWIITKATSFIKLSNILPGVRKSVMKYHLKENFLVSTIYSLSYIVVKTMGFSSEQLLVQ